MSLFGKLLYVYSKNKPHRALRTEYKTIEKLAAAIETELRALRQLQKELVQARLHFNVALHQPSGGIGVKKTEFIEELAKRIKILAQRSQERMEKIETNLKIIEPLSPLEQDELGRVIAFLESVKDRLPTLTEFYAIPSLRDRLLKVEQALRDVTKLAEEFHAVEKHERALARSVLEHEVSPLLRKIYEEPKRISFRHNGTMGSLLASRITNGQLRKLENDAAKINACEDPNYKIIWRRWWSKEQRPEIDPTIPIGPHVNVTIKLFGKPKKDIHLLVA